MGPRGSILACTVLALALCSTRAAEDCAANPDVDADYSGVLSGARSSGIAFGDLPGFTRSHYEASHALITPESRVWATLPGWTGASTAHVISPASGANFAMYLARMGEGGVAAPQAGGGTERFALILDGLVEVEVEGEVLTLGANDYMYFPPGMATGFSSKKGAGLVIYERTHSLPDGKPTFQSGNVDDSPLLPAGGNEVFALRKLLPQTTDYDFNIHIMDFQPGEHLDVKEVHYNQHGLLLLEGKGIYRLANSWYPVQAGDVIWMAPFVPQWYAALGKTRSRYIIYKDTIVDPMFLLDTTQ